MKTVFVTGGAGFIGSALVRRLVRDGGSHVVVLDSLTYAGSLEALADVQGSPNLEVARVDVADTAAVGHLLARHAPQVVFHLAAETHVDNSIDAPAAFVHSNVEGTFGMLRASLDYWRQLPAAESQAFRFLHVSTDEVFGSADTGVFTEDSPYRPRSPYAATKAASDHLVRAWHITYGLPVLVTNCANNFGPFQFPEKLIPLMIHRALAGRPLPVYGDGLHTREWLHVDDHVDALLLVAASGQPGETYAASTGVGRTNLETVHAICAALDTVHPAGAPHARHIEFVADRPGHDRRYALDSSKIRRALGWAPTRDFEAALRDTVAWYVANQTWSALMLERRRTREVSA